MQREERTNQEPLLPSQDPRAGGSDGSTERDPFLIALMEEIEAAVTTEPTDEPTSEPAPPASVAQTPSAPSPAARRERARYGFD